MASAARLRWRAPELALLMADEASTAAAEVGSEVVRLRAEVLAVFACNQLGRGAEAGGRALRALRAAQQAGEVITERLIRIELAACAADASAPSVGLAVLQPVFGRPIPAAVPGAPAALSARAAPTARAAAMVAAADCIARLGGGPEVAVLLADADGLYDTSRSVEPDATLLRRGVVHARLAAYHRRRGDHRSAESTARAGLALVDRLAADELETGQVSGALTLEHVFALLDGGRVPEAVLAAQPVLRRAARPAGAPSACWLRLGLASRVHVPAGRHALARRLLGEAVADAERNGLDAVLAECHLLQAHLQETCAEPGEALHSLRAAHVADRRWRDTTAELRTTLGAEFGHPPPAAELRSAVSGMLAALRSAEASPPLGRGRTAHRSRFRHPTPTAASTAAPGAEAAAEEPAGAARPPAVVVNQPACAGAPLVRVADQPRRPLSDPCAVPDDDGAASASPQRSSEVPEVAAGGRAGSASRLGIGAATRDQLGGGGVRRR